MNDLFLDALGIMDQVMAEGMKGNKKKKARHLDEDFIVSSPDRLEAFDLSLMEEHWFS